MILLYAILVLLFCSFVGSGIATLRALPARRYQRCLQNIARLERELRIGVPGKPEQEVGPGAVWYIDEKAPEAAQRWGVEHGMLYQREMEAAIYYSMAQRGLSYSSARADWEGALQRYQKTEHLDDA